MPWLTFSRLRPDHTFGVIFAFGGSALMGTCYYIVQRTGHTRLALGALANFTFWGWQLGCVLAMVTMPLGITQSKEYAEPEWFIDIAVAVVWVSFGVVFFATIARRRIRHIYVSNWYYGALIIAVGLLHIVNNIALPVSLTKSYPVYSGAVDAMVQWWYGHNAVAFFLTAGFLGMMYYFVPRQAQQPLWSYRFSIVNFWALISIYMWAGPHHLMYTALPDWVQSVGMAFSLILLMPSWGSAANGLLTFNGSWHLLKTDPAAKFMVLSLVFYAAVDARRLDDGDQDRQLADALHRVDGRARALRRARLGRDDHHRLALRDGAARARPAGDALARRDGAAFLAAHAGVLLYLVSMWIAGITQFLMWRATNADGSLTYPFIDSLIAIKGLYVVRWFAGVIILVGMVVMAWNLWHTAAAARAHLIKPIPVPIPEPEQKQVPTPLPADRLTGGGPWRAATSTSRRSRRTRSCSAS